MPEGDTVWNTARDLRRALLGQRLTATDFRVPRLATTDLTGWTVLESASRGKHLLLQVADPAGGQRLTLHSHLRMDGEWRIYLPGQRWAARPAHLIRVVLRTVDSVAVGYRLHGLALLPTDQEHTVTGHLGPDLLGPGWDPVEAVRRISAAPDQVIADALLDQTNLAGIGNVYKCEVLFLRGVSPWSPVREVTDLPALVDLAHRLLAANRGRPRRTTTGSTRTAEATYVYRRAQQPCRRCGTLIRESEQSERITYWCPHCQPGPV